MKLLPTAFSRPFRLLTFLLSVALAGVASAKTVDLTGTVKSGSAVIKGATVTLYFAGHDRGMAPTVLASGVTDAEGRFCTKFQQPVEDRAVLYVIAKGPTSSVRLAAMLSHKEDEGAEVGADEVVVNELSTIATTWAMAQFMHGDEIGGKRPGLQNAAATSGNLVDARTGAIDKVLADYPNGYKTSSWGEFNSLANLISTCVDTSSECSQLFKDATVPGEAEPTNTLQAALNISQNPWSNFPALLALSKKNSNYAPALPSKTELNAWTLALQYYGNGTEFNGPANMAVDGDGFIYVTNNYDLLTGCGSKVLSKLTPTGLDAAGAPFSGGGLNGAGFGITMDPSGHLWAGNFGFKGTDCTSVPKGNSASGFTASGDPQSPPKIGWTAKGMINRPQATVADADGNIWIANFSATNYVTELVGGDPNDVKTFVNDPYLTDTFGIALDAQSNVWVTSGAHGSTNWLTKITPSTGKYEKYTASGMDRPLGDAVDSLGNVWVANVGGDFQSTTGGPGAVVAFKANGEPLEGSPFKGGSIDGAWGIAIDGNDNVWVNDWIGERVTELCGARVEHCPQGYKTGQEISPCNSSPCRGYGSNAMTRLTGIVIDQSGNVWVPNNWLTIPYQTNPGGFGMVELVGAAAPVKAPVFGPPEQP